MTNISIASKMIAECYSYAASIDSWENIITALCKFDMIKHVMNEEAFNEASNAYASFLTLKMEEMKP
ncbi:hypothetical protein [Enterobacter hormaechei]|uniref:hypothetical protein n=1 Tax=Enterobacter hormaechei TaxID=158836 RepID=UPI0029DA73AF|nr:hypothetical protein [Enterobacter hormaechei]MDX7122046.1 hypothetical protein [Enterobacter hormaechei]